MMIYGFKDLKVRETCILIQSVQKVSSSKYTKPAKNLTRIRKCETTEDKESEA